MIADIKKILKYPILQRWNIGFSNTPIEDIIAGAPIDYQWLKHDFKNRWFADPFIFDVTPEEYIVLVEDYEDSRNYAVLSRLVIDRNSLNIKDIKQILDVGSHLSFPVILRQGDRLFVYPENSVSGVLNLYEYDYSKEELRFVRTMIDVPLTDAVILDYEGDCFLFATKLPNPNSNELLVYSFNDDSLTLQDTIIMKDNTARMGGNFIQVGGALYRPAQDNNKVYGGALIIQQVVRDGTTWTFRDVRYISSPNPDYNTGLHTFNHYKGISVFDVHGYRRHPKLAASLDHVRSIIKHI